MVQRILERGQIETLGSRSIPRVRLPDRHKLFAQRAARLRQLANGHAIGGYLQLMATIAAAQQIALAGLVVEQPTPGQLEQAALHRMPPIAASSWRRSPQWREVLQQLVDAVGTQSDVVDSVATLTARLHEASDAWLEAQAEALLGTGTESIDVAAAPFLMAALQVHWLALSAAFAADRVVALDVPGVCPLCGSLPVASVVRARAPYEGHRYLHCALCACEWHRVRVQCSHCGNGKRIGYQISAHAEAATEGQVEAAAVRAETCDECHSYRKILYEEKDPAVEPVADDLASLALDLLLAEQGYHRASGNPLLWQAERN